MGKFFVEKFRNKTKEELIEITRNETGYQAAAVDAAIYLLNTKFNENIPVVQRELPKPKGKSHSFGDATQFFDELSHGEFMTGFTLAVFFQAIYQILLYYSNEPFFEYSFKTVLITVFVLIVLSNHVIYRVEHKRSNNFIGRFFGDIILFVFMILTRAIYEYFRGNTYSFSILGEGMEAIATIFVMVILIMIFEIMISLLKHLLRLIKCPIL